MKTKQQKGEARAKTKRNYHIDVNALRLSLQSLSVQMIGYICVVVWFLVVAVFLPMAAYLFVLGSVIFLIAWHLKYDPDGSNTWKKYNSVATS